MKFKHHHNLPAPGACCPRLGGFLGFFLALAGTCDCVWADPAAEATAKYETTKAQIATRADAAREALVAQQARSLTLLMDAAKAKGDFPALVAAEKERNRLLLSYVPGPIPSAPPAELPGLCQKFSQEVQRLDAERKAQEQKVAQEYAAHLERLMKDLTRAGKLEEAKQVLAALAPVNSAYAVRQPAPPTPAAALRTESPAAPSTSPKTPLPAGHAWLEGGGFRFYTYKSGGSSGNTKGPYAVRALAESVFQPDGAALRLRLPPDKTTHWKFLLGRQPLAPGDEWNVEASGISGLQLADKEDPVNCLIAFDEPKAASHRYRIRRTKDGAQFWVDGAEVKTPLRKGRAESSPSTFAKADLFPCLKVRTEDKPVLHKVTFTAGTGAP